MNPKSVEELAEQIESIVTFEHDGGEDGYSASADAMWKVALLAFNYAADKVGATGFQASYAALKFYGDAMGIDGPFGIVKAENTVYPQYDEVAKVRGWIESEWRPWIVEQAQKHLDKDAAHAVPSVLNHWRRRRRRLRRPARAGRRPGDRDLPRRRRRGGGSARRHVPVPARADPGEGAGRAVHVVRAERGDGVSDEERTVVHRIEAQVSRATVFSRDILGMNLGELRQAVAAAEGMPDKATVKFADLTKSVADGNYYAKRVWIEHEARTT
jgi:hypothetical protein